MRRLVVVSVAFAGAAVGAAFVARPPALTDEAAASIAEGKLPTGYRDWRLISVAREEGTLDDIRAVLGNDIAVKAYREARARDQEGKSAEPKGTIRFPDGAIIARLAWSLVPSDENNKVFGRAQSFVAGSPKHGVQFMVKDSKKYGATGGWAFAQFDDGKPLVDAAMLKGCFDCHALIRDKDRDLVFTQYAP